MMKVVSTSETSVNFYQTSRRNIPEESNLRTRRHENLKSHDVYVRKFNLNNMIQSAYYLVNNVHVRPNLRYKMQRYGYHLQDVCSYFVSALYLHCYGNVSSVKFCFYDTR
jgi:hypothetical protein